MLTAILAAVAMFGQDLVSVILVQAEARNRAHLAGLMDTVGWLLAITTTSISVSTLTGHGAITQKVLVVGLVSIANYAGTVTGTRIGERMVKTKARMPLRTWPARKTLRKSEDER